ncbi:saccharopine dehydrogenase C-terminal domain-containing protein [Pseudovibrio sp. Tun.PSC04-5.I4]|uniref:saccharopine dehydrogenase family protein n=1 Tax=Pseudovibrio sp. Tun.PSC04-5.I4 TaxID=1798213 RepID=UPI0008841254|nr:saccharopine dehydrogenase C-terminal domain-containing protein [Pseudovibrio sp. Tun.PSC04-5.I4]SDQ90724.1 Saccharopine dehydrogenase, NADP-dependent [Pseudovibrio sp. Tun.PSC04-5.I4]
MNRHHVAVVGAGKIGGMIAALLQGSGDYQIKVLDQSVDALSTLDVPHVTTEALDVSDLGKLTAALKGCDAVISAAPFFLTPVIAQAARDADCHYLDLTEDVASTAEVERIAKGASKAFAPQCGLAPGFVSIAGHDLAQQFDRLEDLHLRVGALPRYPTNKLKYNLTWSTDGLINEYCNPCLAIENGELTTVSPLAGLQNFSLDGVDYEAFNTSGGLGSLSETLKGKVQSLRYLSIRYPGHKDIMELLLNDLGFINKRELLKEVMEDAIPATMQDRVLIFITATGMKDGRFQQKSFSHVVNDREIHGKHWSGIQITTAASICATLDLMMTGKLQAKGFVTQESISLADFLANRFGGLYNNDGSDHEKSGHQLAA